VVGLIDDKGTSLALQMVQLRYWQQIMNEDLKKKLFNIPIHVAFGSEAVAVAVSSCMKLDDRLVLTHRNMAFNLARASELKTIYDEYRLSCEGVCGGRKGSMNLINPLRGVIYSSSILGNNFSVACGVALHKRVQRKPEIVIVTTGDGAMEEGGFYEALTFARSHNLKILFLVENNNHSMSSTILQRRCPIYIDKMCDALDIPYKRLVGNDVLEYASEFAKLRVGVMDSSCPVCMEVETVLMNQHAGPTPGWPTDPMSVSLSDGLIIRESTDDPLFILKNTIGDTAFERMTADVLATKWR
jgi:TPP-dependent pyruvate/acetoin dehydrogenase alpha subunit